MSSLLFSKALSDAVGFSFSLAIEAGFKTGLIDRLAKGPTSVETIASDLGLADVETIQSFLHYLEVHDVVEGDGAGRYVLSTMMRAISQDADFLNDVRLVFRLVSRRMVPMWARLDKLLLSGETQSEANCEFDLFPAMYEDDSTAHFFAESMAAFSRLLGARLSDIFHWSNHETVLDVGGCSGAAVFEIVATAPHLKGVVFDLPVVSDCFEQLWAQKPKDVQSRCTFQAGDFFEDSLPACDVLILGQILHNWGDENRLRILKKSFQSVTPGGEIVVYDPILASPDVGHGIQEARVAAFFNMQMRLATHQGSGYDFRHVAALLEEAGFEAPEYFPLIGPFGAIQAKKR